MPDPIRIDIHSVGRETYQFVAAPLPAATPWDTPDASDVGDIVVQGRSAPHTASGKHSMAGDDEIMNDAAGEIEIVNVLAECEDLLRKDVRTGQSTTGYAIYTTQYPLGGGAFVSISITDDGLTKSNNPTADGVRYLSPYDVVTVTLHGNVSGHATTQTLAFDYDKQAFTAVTATVKD